MAHFHARYRDRHADERSYTWVKNRLQESGLAEKGQASGTPRPRWERAEIPGLLVHQDRFVTRIGAGEMVGPDRDDGRRDLGGVLRMLRGGGGAWSSFRRVRETLQKRGMFSSLARGPRVAILPHDGGLEEVDKASPTQFGRAMGEIPSNRCGSIGTMLNSETKIMKIALAALTRCEQRGRNILATAFVLTCLSASGEDYKYHVPYFLSAASNHGAQESFVRIVWPSCRTRPDLTITAVDDGGKSYGPIEVPWRPGPSGCGEIVNFNSRDLEDGNPEKGVGEGIGAPDVGDWQLFIESTSPVTVASYIRTSDGFLTSMNDVAPWYPERRAYYVSTFNPARNQNQRSRLRIINPNAADIRVQVLAQHDQVVGAYDYGPSIPLAPLEAISVTAEDLETYHSDWDIPPYGGQIGERGHAGKWRLYLRAADPQALGNTPTMPEWRLIVMNIMDTPGIGISNLSSVPDMRSVVIEDDPAVGFNIDVVFREDMPSVN